MTNYLENELLDHLLGTGAYTAPSTVYVKLHTGAPGESAAVNAATETTRVAATFGAAASKAASNSAIVSWSNVAATEVYTHFSLWDALTVGNPLFVGTMSSGSVNASDDFDIAIGDLDITMSGAFTTFSANEMLDHVLGVASYTMPTGQFIKLHIGAPGDAATANPAGETTRVDTGAFSAAGSGATDNDAVIAWTSVSTAETYSHWSMWTSATVGDPLLVGALTVSKVVTVGQDAEFAAAAFAVAAA